MKTHTVEGERMLQQVGGLLSSVGVVVRASHERWDGGGYPDGLAGEAIPLAARIVSACDAFNAMTTDRSYRKALPLEVAIAELHASTPGRSSPPTWSTRWSRSSRADAPRLAARHRRAAPARQLSKPEPQPVEQPQPRPAAAAVLVGAGERAPAWPGSPPSAPARAGTAAAGCGRASAACARCRRRRAGRARCGRRTGSRRRRARCSRPRRRRVPPSARPNVTQKRLQVSIGPPHACVIAIPSSAGNVSSRCRCSSSNVSGWRLSCASSTRLPKW